MARLSEWEIKVLKILKEKGKVSTKELESLGIPKDSAQRALYFLSQKGLSKIREKTTIKLVLTELGKKVMEGQSLEEDEILSKKDEEVKRLGELSKYLGNLKENGFISIENGRIKILRKNFTEFVRNLLKNLDKVSEKEKRFLKRRGLIEEKEEKEYIGEITDMGKAYELEEMEGISALTVEMFKEQSWKGKELKPLNIPWKDIEWPKSLGKLSLVSLAIERIRRIFLSMGFEEMHGNYTEVSFWNFDALLQPQDHPARDLADTFYIPGKSTEEIPKELIESVKEAEEEFWGGRWKLEEALKLVLRTHTTVLSARTLYKKKRGKYFAIGKVFRNEAIDYKHLAEFHQVEGIISYPGVKFKHLLGVINEFYRRLGFEKVRFRPSYFPYTEPSLEIEVFFEPKGEWVELGGAGMFRREMLKALGVENDVLAWGLSLERPLMLLLGNEDIRDFYRTDLEFAKRIRAFEIRF